MPKQENILVPYTGSFDLNQLVNLLRKSFLIRNCSDYEFAHRKKPCLEYQIKKCSAPCTKYISKAAYKKSIQATIDIIEGKNSQLISKELISKMNQHSDNLEYEKALIMRDRVKSLNMVTAKQKVYNINLKNAHIIVLYEYQEQIIIALFRFRNGMNYGEEYFYPTNIANHTEILAQFIRQFYDTKISIDEIITNVKFTDKKEIIEYLYHKHKAKIKITLAQQNYKKEIVDFALNNAKFQIKQKLASDNKSINNQKLHEKLKEVFALEKTPDRIDIFDNSHIFGSYAVGAMVVSSKKGFLKSQYRKFNIKNILAAGDDYAMLKEVLIRRYSKMLEHDPKNKKSSWPDLILIDGGKGQATITQQVFNYLNLNIPFYCIAKGKERNKGKERFCNGEKDYFTITEPKLLYYLQNIRDEAHRFAITTHRNKRAKALIHSQLDDIPKIGAKRKKILLTHFGSVAAIKSAAIEDIAKLENFSIKLAKEIKEILT